VYQIRGFLKLLVSPIFLLKSEGERGLRKNYFARLVKYTYHIERGFNKLTDGRVNPTYSTGQVIFPVFFGLLLRIKSFNELSLMIKNHEFSQLFPRGTKLPQIDAIRDTLKVMDIDGLKQINQQILKTALQNKTFENHRWIYGGTIDGTIFFGGNKKSCSECLKKPKVKRLIISIAALSCEL